VPDVAFVSYAKQSHADKKGFNKFSLDCAIQVISDSGNKQELRDLWREISGYLNVGT
jgi:hypothetical protein